MITKKFTENVEVVTALVIQNNKEEILLANSQKWLGKWVIPGGHIELGESIADSARREAKEETGLETFFVSVIDWGEIMNPPEFFRPAHFIYFIVYLKTDLSLPKMDKSELSDFKWVPKSEVLILDLTNVHRNILKRFLDDTSKQK